MFKYEIYEKNLIIFVFESKIKCEKDSILWHLKEKENLDLENKKINIIENDIKLLK